MKEQTQKSIQDSHHTTNHRPDYWVRAVAFSVVIVWALWLAYVSSLATGKITWPVDVKGQGLTIDKLGQLGDAFGALNVLFTALAFVAVWWTGRMQREELIMQRNELQLQRQELKSTRATVAMQGFESMFFQTLRLIRDQRDALENVDSGEQLSGLQWFAKRCSGIFHGLPSSTLTGSSEVACEQYGASYVQRIYNVNQNLLGPYFRTLFYIFELIDTDGDLDEGDKFRYAKLAAAQLSANEIVILAAHGCGKHGRNFRDYIEKYALLKHYPNSLQRDFIKHLFDSSAFG